MRKTPIASKEKRRINENHIVHLRQQRIMDHHGSLIFHFIGSAACLSFHQFEIAKDAIMVLGQRKTDAVPLGLSLSIILGPSLSVP